jgi:hypothetical protein
MKCELYPKSCFGDTYIYGDIMEITMIHHVLHHI